MARVWRWHYGRAEQAASVSGLECFKLSQLLAESCSWASAEHHARIVPCNPHRSWRPVWHLGRRLKHDVRHASYITAAFPVCTSS